MSMNQQELVGQHLHPKFTSENVSTLIILELKIFQKKLESYLENKDTAANSYRIQAYDSIMCGYFCIEYIDLILNSKRLLEYTNIFSSDEYKENDKIKLKYFQ